MGKTNSNTALHAVEVEETIPPDLLRNLLCAEPAAIELLADWENPSIFNPIIGDTTKETLDNICDLSVFLQNLAVSEDENLRDDTRATAMLQKLIWSSANYERERLGKKGGAA